MASYTTGLKLTQPNLGDTGWGTTVNSGVTALVDQAVAGAVSVAVTAGGTTTLSAIANGASSDARNMSLLITGSLTTGQTATVRVPATGAGVTKLYSIRNEAGQTVAVETSGGDEVSIPHNRALLVRVTSTGVYEAVNYASSLTLDTALAATSGGTGQSSYAVGDLLYAGTTTTLTKLAAAAVGNVLRAKGTGTAPAWEKVNLTLDVTSVLPTGNGGTGVANPGASGNVLSSDGTNWQSVAVSTLVPDASTTAKGVVELATDAEVQTGTDTTRAITPDALRKGALVLDTVKASTSGTAVDFTAIPSWVKRITVTFNQVSTNGSDNIIVQLGDSGGFESTGYLSGAQLGAGIATSTRGFLISRTLVAGSVCSGALFITKVSANDWVYSAVIYDSGSTGATTSCAGFKQLSDVLTQLRITTDNASPVNTFDAGSINIMYE